MQASNPIHFKIIISIFLILFFSIEIFSQVIDRKDSADKNNSLVPISKENPEDLVHIGDLIDVDIVGSTEYDWRGGITPEGFLNGLSFTEEPIYALCKTEREIAIDVAKGYEKLLRDPQVIVKIIDRSHRPVSLLYGAVRIPQRFQIRRSVKLNELIILAGGLTDRANGEIQIQRSPNLNCEQKKESKEQSINSESSSKTSERGAEYINIKIADLLKGKPEANPQILIGDVVTILESKPIYMTGGVVNPKSIDARSQINLSRAISAAGGLARDADAKKITIFRTENKETKVIEVDFEKIKLGQADDIDLKAFDIVEVAQKGKGKNRYVPISANDEDNKINFQKLPLKVID